MSRCHEKVHELYGDVVAVLIADPTFSANDIYRQLRADGKHVGRADVLKSVKTLRRLPGVPASGRGPGRPKKAAVPFFQGRGGDTFDPSEALAPDPTPIDSRPRDRGGS